MIVGERSQALHEAKKLFQGDMEKRTGLLRCYVSRLENGHSCSSYRDPGENGPCFGDATLCGFVRW
jgi:hypothetical protein